MDSQISRVNTRIDEVRKNRHRTGLRKYNQQLDPVQCSRTHCQCQEIKMNVEDREFCLELFNKL